MKSAMDSLAVQLRTSVDKSACRVWYGMENKLPTLDHLYPDKIYRDFMVLNAYMQNPELDHLITYTYIHNPENPIIRENRNVKKEIGIDMTYKRFDFSLTLFHEESRRGFAYFESYLPIAFDRYTKLIAPLQAWTPYHERNATPLCRYSL